MAILPEQPAIMALPFATNGDKATIPSSPVFGRASLSDGFPIETGLDLSEGGVPPDRLDFNGILHLLSQFAYWVQSGGVPTWNNTLDYVPPARVAGSDGKFYKCVAQSGPTIEDIGPKDPTVEGNTDYWILDDPGSGPNPDVSTIVGEIKFLPFRPEHLPTGWYFANGTKYEVTSKQGEVLNAFPTQFKTDWDITITDEVGVAKINVPNMFATDNTGAMLIPCNGTGLEVGQVQEDAGRNFTGGMNLYNGVGFLATATGIFGGGGAVAYCFSYNASGNIANTLLIEASRAWGSHIANRFKVYGRGATPAIYLGV